jgi:hypothetical protein
MFHNSRGTSARGPGLATKAAIISSKILKYCSSMEMKYLGRRINKIVAVISMICGGNKGWPIKTLFAG